MNDRKWMLHFQHGYSVETSVVVGLLILSLQLRGLHTISPEFCSENHSLTITNNNIVNRGIIYSPTYPEEYDSVSTRGNHCNVTISGLFESSWIRLKQSYVEKFSTSPRRTYQPCIEQDFIINNQSLPKNHYHCQIREGTLLNRQSITFQLNFAQRKMPPFTIEYTIYPLLLTGTSDQRIVDLSVIPEAYISLIPNKHYGNLTTTEPYTPITVASSQVVLQNLRPITSMVDIDLQHMLGDSSNCYRSLLSHQNFLRLTVMRKDYRKRIDMSCDDAEMFHFSQKRIIFNPNLDSFIQFSFGMGESKPSYKLLVKYKAHSCDEDIQHLNTITPMEGATHAPIYSITCEPGYYLNTDRKHMECRGGDWLPQKPQCFSVNKTDDLPSKYEPFQRSHSAEVESLIALFVLMLCVTLTAATWKLHRSEKFISPSTRLATETSERRNGNGYGTLVTAYPSEHQASSYRGRSQLAIDYNEEDHEIEIEFNRYQETRRLKQTRRA